jgi:hypothetical protein
VAIYRHRQIGTVMLWGLGAGVLLTALPLPFIESRMLWIVTAATAILTLACLPLFGTLTVEIDAELLTVAFGVGWIRRRFSVSEIRAARAVRNPWYYGWGIRLTPDGWMFNVSGLDAVEIDLAGDRKFLIGTDEPQQLLAAIERARARHG